MEEDSEQSIVEEREELMVSPTGGNPTRRQAYFLKPFVNGTVSDFLSPSLSLPSPTFDPRNCPLMRSFKHYWRYPGTNLAKWVGLLLPRYESVWKQAGIYDAILSTTHTIKRDDDLVCGITERWCADTKSFVFGWGEATITLEDVMVLGGFSVIGKPLSLPLITTEMKKVEERLVVARMEIVKSKGIKARQNLWLKKFMGSGSDIEHEAFLVWWLCRFIFPSPSNVIQTNIFPIAIHLARGTRIALAPPVLAAIYRELTVLKQAILGMNKPNAGADGTYALSRTLWSRFHLVQLWVWERFPELQPIPNSLKEGDTRSARWHKAKGLGIENVRSVLDSAGESFIWRPYTNVLHNWEFHKFYKEHQGWVHVDEELLTFTCCIRISQLVGRGFVEQYLPHRVAMQFGMDQDLPVDVPQPDVTPRKAWSNYCKPTGTMLYIPPRLFESDVTFRYFEWWKQNVVGRVEDVLQQPKSSKRLKRTMQDSKEKARTIHPRLESVMKVQLLPEDGVMACVKKRRSKRRARNCVMECESLLLQELRSMNKKANGAEPFSCFQSKSHSSSTASHEGLRYKSLEEIAGCEASMQAMKGADGVIKKPKLEPEDEVGETDKVVSQLKAEREDGTMKKPKLEPEDEVGEIDKVIAQLREEFADMLAKPYKKPNAAELEKIIAELRQEFGMSSEY